MWRNFAVLLAFGLLAGCQDSQTVPRAAPPPLQRPSLVPRPLPPQYTYAPRYEVLPPQREAAPTGPPYRYQYGSSRSAAASTPHASPASPAPSAPAKTAVPATPAPSHALASSWAPQAPVRGWKWIVVHHSDTSVGSAASFGRYHREVRHWSELGYHFVIDNGNGGRDGRVEIGGRWTHQREGAHAGVALYNDYGIGICLVGDFNTSRPTAAQLQSLAQLIAYLMRTYHIPADHVIGHRDIRKTDCPGRFLDISTIRQMAAHAAR